MNVLRVHSPWGRQLNVNHVQLAGSVQLLMAAPMLFAPQEHLLLVMLRPVLTAQLVTTAQQLIPSSYLVQMAVTPSDYKMPVPHALQVLVVHRPQQLQQLRTIAFWEVTVLGDNSRALCVLRGLLVHRHVLMT